MRLILLGALYLMICGCMDNKRSTFSDYRLSDTLSGVKFYFYEDSLLTYNNQKFYKFNFDLLDNRIGFTGFLNIDNNSIFIYHPDLKEKIETFRFNVSENYCDSIKIAYNLKADSVYYQQVIKNICNNGFFSSNDGDSIYKFIITDFSLLRKNDNLGLYISKKKGIVGWCSQLEDGLILYYQGNIYGDTLKTLEKAEKVLK